MKLLYPDRRCESIYQINLKELKEKGIRGIIADLDNTLVAWRSETIPPSLIDWLKRINDEGFKLCLLSNAGGKRAERMGKLLKLPVIAPALKPSRTAFEKGVKILKLSAEEIAVVGDQVFMDILGGNRAGMYTILVRPISKREFIGTRLIRLLERLVLLRFEQEDADKIKENGSD